jgi:cytochrome c553
MKKTIFVSVLCMALLACEKKAEEKVVDVKPAEEKAPAKKEFKMYEMSEMAALMEQMYVDNMRLKERIIAGDTIGAFPRHFLNIHASAMTDESDNDAFFKMQSKNFLAAQELIYNDSLNAKKHFNDAVSSCVKCHEQKCEGPIPRIKKLYIK